LRNGIRELHDWRTEVILFFGIFAGTTWVQQPSRFSFFGDSWDVLYLLLVDHRTILQPHNEHFIPLFNILYFAQYKLFGAHHLGYMLVLYLLHALAAVFVYRIGRQIQLPYWSSIIAALLFSFSSVSWEVLGWSFEQQFGYGVVFLLASLDTFLRGAPRKRSLLYVFLLSLVGYWAGGPIGIVLPMALTAYWLVRYVNERDALKGTVVRVLAALWSPLLLYYVTLRIGVSYTSDLPVNPIVYPEFHLNLLDIPGMLDFSIFGTVWGLVLPTLTFIHSQTMKSAPVIFVLLAMAAMISYRRFSEGERLSFWLMIWNIVGAYLVISLGRLTFGVETAGSSRYQYLSTAPFALLLVLCWSSLQRGLASNPAPLWWYVLSFAFLAYFMVFHAERTRVDNPAADRGVNVQEFLAAATKASFPATEQKGTSVLGAAFAVPNYFTAIRRPFWMILQVIDGNTRRVVPEEKYLTDEGKLEQFNLIGNGGFEQPLGSEWRSFAGAEFSRDATARHHGDYGVNISLPAPGSAFSRDVVNDCSPNVAGKIFTFTMEANTRVPAALIARMLFKGADGRILAAFSSEPHSGDAQWHQLITGGLSPTGTCIIGVDVTDAGTSGLSGTLDDALLLLHPGILSADGVPSFQTPQQVSAWR
jgi:hypothetical protein